MLDNNTSILEPMNGYFDVVRSSSVNSPNPKPAIFGLSNPTDEIVLPNHSTVIEVFVNPTNANELSYYPIQASQICYR